MDYVGGIAGFLPGESDVRIFCREQFRKKGKRRKTGEVSRGSGIAELEQKGAMF